MTKPDFNTARRAMIDGQLRTSGVNEPWVTQAMGDLPREKFVAKDKQAICYMDRAIALDDGRALSPPVTTGMMLQQAAPGVEDNILLIGGGCGYVAALLADRTQQLVIVEESAALSKQARKAGGFEIINAPLNAGHAGAAPYSLIWIDGGIEELPGVIADQLADGGRIITGLVDGPTSQLAMGVKRGGKIALRSFADGEIHPLPGFAKAKEFAF